MSINTGIEELIKKLQEYRNLSLEASEGLIGSLRSGVTVARGLFGGASRGAKLATIDEICKKLEGELANLNEPRKNQNEIILRVAALVAELENLRSSKAFLTLRHDENIAKIMQEAKCIQINQLASIFAEGNRELDGIRFGRFKNGYFYKNNDDDQQDNDDNLEYMDEEFIPGFEDEAKKGSRPTALAQAMDDLKLSQELFLRAMTEGTLNQSHIDGLKEAYDRLAFAANDLAPKLKGPAKDAKDAKGPKDAVVKYMVEVQKQRDIVVAKAEAGLKVQDAPKDPNQTSGQTRNGINLTSALQESMQGTTDQKHRQALTVHDRKPKLEK